ncbi:MAG: DUF423 domain-containing protein [Opitutaceae bacterium]|nr:DUF423 domain-containing protein [Opitutaceae bacterium]
MKFFFWASALSGSSAVIFGALGAHALKDRLAGAGHLESWKTASLYHIVHAVALIAVLSAAQQAQALGDTKAVRAWKRVAMAWLTGVVLFSGSIYALSLGGPSWLGPVTPLGGLILIMGWLLIVFTRTPAKS